MANHIRAWHYFRPPGESQALQRIPEKPMALSQSAVTLTDISSAQKNWVFAQYVYPSLCSRGWTLIGKCSFMVGNTYVRLCFSRPVASRHDVEVIVFQPYNVGDWTEDIKLAASQDLYVLCPSVSPLHLCLISLFPAATASS